MYIDLSLVSAGVSQMALEFSHFFKIIDSGEYQTDTETVLHLFDF